MTVYVDKAFHPYGRMIMCHMFADTRQELIGMARSIGVDPKWLQKAGTPHEHIDISKGKRSLALERGAVEIDRRQVYQLIRTRREAWSEVDREHGPRTDPGALLSQAGTEEGPLLPGLGLHGDP